MDGPKTIMSKEELVITDINMTSYKAISPNFAKILQNSFLVNQNVLAHPKNNPTIFYSVNEEINDNCRICRYYDITAIYKPIYEEISKLKLENSILSKKANTDNLTSLHNKASLESFNSILEDSDVNYVYVMCDIDKFKFINDTYGHEKGDFVLDTIGRIFKKYASKDCFIARYGGDEFTLIFKNSSCDEVIKILYKISMDVRNTDIGLNECITLSSGISISKPNVSIDSIIREADSCLYTAKNNGRNGIGFIKNGILYFSKFPPVPEKNNNLYPNNTLNYDNFKKTL